MEMLDTTPRRRGRPPAVERTAVLDAARAVLRDEGPRGITVRRVAEVLGVSRQVVYTSFGSLGGLVDALYRHGFEELLVTGGHREAAPAATGTERVIALALAYRRSALERPELYSVMFERPFRDYAPSSESRAVALSAFEPLVDAVAAIGRSAHDARDTALTLWAAMHGVVHLELQGYVGVEGSSERRIVELVTAVLDTDAPETEETT